jgi:hypothetical protein
VLVTSSNIRPFVRGIVERFRAQTPVLSQGEVHPRARLKTIASIWPASREDSGRSSPVNLKVPKYRKSHRNFQ